MKMLKLYSPVLSLPALFSLVLAATVLAQDNPTTQPAEASAVIAASDRAALDKAIGTDVIVEGTISVAEWSRSGKVMNIEFKDSTDGLLAVVFERNRKAMDEAYSGDLANTLKGAKVRLKGVIKPYGGREESKKGRPQIIIDRPTQITIVEPAPTTQPTN